ETYTEMIENLGYKNLELDVLNSYNQKLLKELPSLDNTSFVSIANGFWANNELPIRESYKSQISNYYQANISNIDSQNMKNHIAEINAWCDEKTKHMIPSLVEPDDDFDALIANALCFEGTWRNGFDKNFTTTDKFYNENGSASNVLMMNRTDTFRVSFDYGLRVIDIPFGNESFSMYVIMSEDDNENIVEVVSSLNNANWTNIKERLRTMKINLSLPKFEIKNTINFKPILTSMGFEKTFSDCPDFSNLCNGMKVSKVFQKNYFKIDENGAKAASVTVSEMNDTGLGTTSPKFKVNRPFIFLIAEKSSSVILFAGIIREM
ncbi:MAG: hypothetical protein HUJ97_06420, partial [Bacteroidales bacterium]|nr:hypothetical protein [Bacteroidales bacterium]